MPSVCLITRRLSRMVAWSIAFLAPAVFAQTPPEHIEAYVQLVKAEQAENRGERAEALDYYLKGLALYTEVAHRYPSWQPDVVRYRITHSRNQADRIRRLLEGPSANGAGAPDEPVDPAVEPQPEPLVPDSREQDWQAERQALELALEESEAERATLLERVQTLDESLADQQRAFNDVRAAHQQDIERIWATHQREQEALQARFDRVQSEAQAAFDEALAGAQAAVEPVVDEAALAAAAQRQEALEAEVERLFSALEKATGETLTFTYRVTELEQELAAEREARAARDEAFAAIVTERDAMVAELEEWRGFGQTAIEVNRKAQAHVAELEIEAARVDVMAQEHADAMAAVQAELARAGEQVAVREQEVEAAREAVQQAERQVSLLNAEIAALNKTIESSRGDVGRVRELRATIRNAELENRRLERELQAALRDSARAAQDAEIARLRNLTVVQQEEIKAFKEYLAGLERRIREYERAASGRR